MREKILIASFAILIMVSVYQCKKVTTFPDELVGVWTTAEPKYKGSFFEIMLTRVNIRTIEGDVINNIIKKIKKEEIPSKKCILYSIFCEDQEGMKSKFFLYYYPSNHEIRFKNQKKFAWRKNKKR